MPSRSVHVRTPSRLHFGMFSFGRPETRQFGGVGAMVEAPGLELSVGPAASFCTSGPLAERAVRYAESLRKHGWFDALPACRVDVRCAPRQHVGLGSGTQLALAVAAGLNAFVGGPARATADLALAVGRGERSAIGSHGFARGGFLIEEGKAAGEAIAPLATRAALPAEWRFVLVCPAGEEGLSGDAERRAFERLPSVPVDATERLWHHAWHDLLPAALAGDARTFGEALFCFGHEAGLCFATRQHGAYASPRVAALVERLRAWGIAGVVQSSWGPTVAALTSDAAEAEALVERLRRDADLGELDVVVTAPNNEGAVIRVSEAGL